MAKQTGVILIIFCFCLNCILGPERVYAQASLLDLPIPGTMVNMTPAFLPTVIRGIKIDPENPFHMDFIVDRGQVKLSDEDLKKEAKKSIKYFLAALTIPEDDLWVNLSPYEKNKIIPENLGLTEMGRDMLAQDYILKQLTSSLIYPESALGKKFWKRVYDKAYQLYHTIQIPVNTFNKVWILPHKAVIFENGDKAFVVKARLKVMMEADYLSRKKNLHAIGFRADVFKAKDVEKIGDVSASVIREVILPEIEKEVNEGQNFMQLRQIYYSLILATWFKRNLRESFLGKTYVEKNKISGVDVKDKETKQKIYRLYLRAFKKGVYNYIKEDYDPGTQQLIPRKYFSGGEFLVGRAVQAATETIHSKGATPAQISQAMDAAQKVEERSFLVGADLENTSNAAMVSQLAQADLTSLRYVPFEKIVEVFKGREFNGGNLTSGLAERFAEEIKNLSIVPDGADRLSKRSSYSELRELLSDPNVVNSLKRLNSSPPNAPSPSPLARIALARRAVPPATVEASIPKTPRILDDRSNPEFNKQLTTLANLTKQISGNPKIKIKDLSEALKPVEITPGFRMPDDLRDQLASLIKEGKNIFYNTPLPSETLNDSVFLLRINKALQLLLDIADFNTTWTQQTLVGPRRAIKGGNSAMIAQLDAVQLDYERTQVGEGIVPARRVTRVMTDIVKRAIDAVGITRIYDTRISNIGSIDEANRELENKLDDPVEYVLKRLTANDKGIPSYIAGHNNRIYRAKDGELVFSYRETTNGEKEVKFNKLNYPQIEEFLGGLLTLTGENTYRLGLRPQYKRAANARPDAAMTKGGIDFNPNELQIEKRGTGTRFNTIDFKNPDQAMINGLTPVIVQVSPITDLPHLLGIPQNQQPVS